MAQRQRPVTSIRTNSGGTPIRSGMPPVPSPAVTIRWRPPSTTSPWDQRSGAQAAIFHARPDPGSLIWPPWVWPASVRWGPGRQRARTTPDRAPARWTAGSAPMTTARPCTCGRATWASGTPDHLDSVFAERERATLVVEDHNAVRAQRRRHVLLTIDVVVIAEDGEAAVRVPMIRASMPGDHARRHAPAADASAC